MAENISKSATNSPVSTQKRLPTPSSISVTNSPRIVRTNRYMHKIFENEKIKEEARRMLMDGQQKLIIIPTGKSGPNGKIPQVKVCSTNSSDSSEGKPTPPRHKRHHHNRVSCSKPVTKNYTWRPNVQDLKTPRNSPSLRSLKTHSEEKPSDTTMLPASPSLRSFTCSDVPVTSLRPLSDVASVRSLISIGMGSTDGKKLVIRRVPTSPSDLLNFAHTP